MDAHEDVVEVEYYLDFDLPADTEPDIEQLKAFVRSLDEQNPWDAGTDANGNKLPSILEITCERRLSNEVSELIGYGLVRVCTLFIKPGNWRMPSWDAAWRYNDYVNEHTEYGKINSQLPNGIVQVKSGIWMHPA